MEIRLRHITIVLIIALAFLSISTIVLVTLPYMAKLTRFSEESSGTYSLYSGLRRWGITRGKDGAVPRADPGAEDLLNKYNSIFVGDTTKKTIYLTFDEGYENGYTEKILDILYENKVNAIFFITGPYLREQGPLIKRMLDEGHAVGNHTINHKSLPLIDDSEIEEEVVGLDKRFYQEFGQNMVFLRPPKGEYSERSLAITSKLGYVNVFWSFAYDDWAVDKQRGWEYTFEKVKQNIHNGEIILLHAVSKDNCEALGAIIEYVRSIGYEFGDVFELEKLAKGEG